MAEMAQCGRTLRFRPQEADTSMDAASTRRVASGDALRLDGFSAHAGEGHDDISACDTQQQSLTLRREWLQEVHATDLAAYSHLTVVIVAQPSATARRVPLSAAVSLTGLPSNLHVP